MRMNRLPRGLSAKDYMKGEKMSKEPRAMLGRELQQQLVDSGILPELCRRVVIDVPTNEPVMVYYECYSSTKLLQLDLPRYLKNAVKVSIDDKPRNNQNQPQAL